MVRSNDDGVLGWAARRAEQRPSFLAAPLATYRDIHGVAEEQLADFLRCPVGSLPTLALCRNPNLNEAGFRRAVERIASFVNADGVRLGQLLREVEAVEALRRAREAPGRATDVGLLTAARDVYLREPDPSDGAPDVGDAQVDEEP